MRNAIKICSLFCLCWLFASQSCQKPKEQITGGGKGGNAIIRVIPEHANLFVDSCTIYIKYGVTDAPASGIYDDSAVCLLNISGTDTLPVATFRGLTRGLYYLQGKGYHRGYSPPYVQGGIPATCTTGSDSETIYIPTYSYSL